LLSSDTSLCLKQKRERMMMASETGSGSCPFASLLIFFFTQNWASARGEGGGFYSARSFGID